ncbi:hypothetical protein EJB05_37772, partial [Eragrostis curvula]
MVATARIFSRCLVAKLLTPMALARPRRWHSSMARHTPSKSNGSASSFLFGNPGGPGFRHTGQDSRRDGSTRSWWHCEPHSLVVTNTSSLDWTRPRRTASATASPSGFSVPYMEAVSMWRYPTSMAASTAFLVFSCTVGNSTVPRPTAGIGR